jgi:protoheme IX farnesyltransferase
VIAAVLHLKDRICAYAELTKPGITAMVMLTAFVGFALATAHETPVLSARSLLAVAGTGLVAAGASALNMFLERSNDALMERTRRRPLPAGRLAPGHSVVFGLSLSFAGWTLLAVATSLAALALSALTWALYLFAYTPLKTRTHWATYVGAVPGALPPVIGWAASGRELTLATWIPFAILFCWQIPHFLAIAWVYRDDYARGGLRVLSVIDPSGGRTVRQSLALTLALCALSLLPAALGTAGAGYLAAVMVLGAALSALAARFALRRDRRAARALFLASLPYLALVQAALLLGSRGLV